jgi:hypothetical protein
MVSVSGETEAELNRRAKFWRAGRRAIFSARKETRVRKEE